MDSKYAGFAEEFLVKQAQQGDQDAEEYLIRKYKDVVRGKAHRHFILGADGEDIVQEGMIGIFKAIRGYDETKHASFRTFAELCVNRQILSAIRAAARQKHSPLNNSLSFSEPLSEAESDKTIEDVLFSNQYSNPEALYILKEDMTYLELNSANIFSNMELRVWGEYLKGKNYNQIAQSIGKTPKAIDNAIQRAKRKLEEYLGVGK